MFKLSANSKYYIMLSAVLAVMIGFLFRESFSGMILQGLDDNISMRAVIVRSLLSEQGYHFISNYWIGFIFNVPNPDFYNTILALTGSEKVIGIYVLALVLSGFVTFKLIRRLEVSPTGAIFGAISYTFLPHVLSLVYSGHALALEAIPMTPAFLLCISVLLDGKTDSKVFKVLAGIWGGIFWAWMMIGEPQRGIYGTVLGMAWTVYLLVQTKAVSFKSLFSKPKEFISKQTITKKIAYLFIILIVGLGVFLSTIKFWANSEFLTTQGSWEFSTAWSFPPSELIDSFAFGYHGLSSSEADAPYHGDKPMSGNSDSLGFFLMFFMICAVSLAWKSQKKGLRFFTIAGLLALFLAFGKYFPGTPFFWLWYHVPGMDKLRVPAKFLSITGLSWSIVAAMGLDSVKELFESNQEKIKKNFLIVLASVAVISVLWFVLLFFTDGGDATVIRKILGRENRAMVDAALTGRINAVLSMASIFVTVMGMAIFFIKKPKFAKFFPILIIILTMQNLYVSNRFYIERTYVTLEQAYPRTELIAFLEDNLTQGYRASGSLFIPNLTASPHPMGAVIEQALYPLNNYDLTYAFPYYDINMFGRIPISRLDDEYVSFFKSAFDSVPAYETYDDIWEMNRRLWYIGNVKYLLIGAENEQAFADQIARDTVFITNITGSYNQSVSVYELKNKLPRFALIHNVKIVYDLFLFKDMSESLRDIENFILPIEESGIEITENQNILAPLVVEPNRVGYNKYVLDLDLTEDKVLYFGDLFDEGWKALANDENITIYKANGIQQYMYLPAGTKQVEIFYDRPVEGLFYSRLLIVLATIFALAVWIMKKRFI